MKIFKLVFLSWFLLIPFQAAIAHSSPTGYWKTIDDVSGKPKAIVKIWASENKKLFGKVVKIYPQPGRPKVEVCKACHGERKDKPVVGMTILEDLSHSKENQNEWLGGNILDPKNGKIYHAALKVQNGGHTLLVRGYIGLPLFGRTQKWLRVNKPSSS